MGSKMSRPRIMREESDLGTDGNQLPPTGMPNPRDGELHKRPIFLSVPTLVHPDEDTMSAISEETTTLLTRSTNSSISNLSFDSKNSQKSVIERGRNFSKYLALPSNKVIVLHNKRRHSTPQEQQEKLDEAAIVVASQIPLFNKVVAPPLGHRLYCPPPRSELVQGVSVSPITELEEYDTEVMSIAKSRVLTSKSEHEISNSSRHLINEQATKSRGDVWLEKALQCRNDLCNDVTRKVTSSNGTNFNQQVNMIDVLSESHNRESKLEESKLSKSCFYSNFHRRPLPGRLKKETNCTYVQKSIFSFCTGLANQQGKAKKKGGGQGGDDNEFTSIDKIMPGSSGGAKDLNTGLRVSSRYRYTDEKITHWSYNLNENAAKRSPCRSKSWASGEPEKLAKEST